MSAPQPDAGLKPPRSNPQLRSTAKPFPRRWYPRPYPIDLCLSIRSKGGQTNALKTLSLFNFTKARDLTLLLPFQTPAGSLPLEQAWMQKR